MDTVRLQFLYIQTFSVICNKYFHAAPQWRSLIFKDCFVDDLKVFFNKGLLSEQILESEVPREFVLPYMDGSNRGMYTFELEALEDGSIFYGGSLFPYKAPLKIILGTVWKLPVTSICHE